jgi:hypothetical protein
MLDLDAGPATCAGGRQMHVSCGVTEMLRLWWSGSSYAPRGAVSLVAWAEGSPRAHSSVALTPQSTEVEKHTPGYRLGKGGDFSLHHLDDMADGVGGGSLGRRGRFKRR